jgi:hypothetical protein
MIYAYKDNGKWVIASLMPRFRGIGGWHTLTDAERAEHGWYPCVEVNADYNPTTQIRSTPTFVLEDGVVTATYTIWDKPESQVYNEAADAVRSERDKLIANTDWMALTDNTLTPEWETYRQALRDITEHENFPHLTDDDWPVKPE